MQQYITPPDAQQLGSGPKISPAQLHAKRFTAKLHRFSGATYQAPSSHTAFMKLAKVSLASGEFDAAIKHYSSAIKLRPNGEELYLERAIAFVEAERYNEALDDFSNTLKINKHNPRVYVERAKLYTALGNLELAKADLEHTIPLTENMELDLIKETEELFHEIVEPSDPAVQNRIDHLMEGAMASFNKQVYPAAIALYSEVLELEPTHSLAIGNRAQAYVRMYDYRNALIDMEQAIELDPTCATLHMSKGYIHLRMGERKKALPVIQKSIKMDPKLAEAYAYRAECIAENDRDAAFSDLNFALKMLPDFWEAYQYRGLLHLDDEAWMEAAKDFASTLDLNSRAYQAFEGLEQIDEHYRWSISRNPDDPQAHIRRAHFLNLIGRPEEALGHWDKALQLEPKSPILLHGRAMIRRELDQLPYALIDMNKVIDQVQDQSIYYRDRAIILSELLRPKEALYDLNSAIKLDPSKSEYYLIKGRLLRMKANYEESLSILLMAKKLGRSDEELHKEIALCYLALQDVEKAAEHYRIAVEDSLYPELAFDYASVLMWLGKYQEAIPYLDYTLQEEPNHWEALMERAEAMGKLFHFEAALEDLELAAEFAPNNAVIWLRRAEIYALMDNWGLVEKACEQALIKDYRLTEAKELLVRAQTNYSAN